MATALFPHCSGALCESRICWAGGRNWQSCCVWSVLGGWFWWIFRTMQSLSVVSRTCRTRTSTSSTTKLSFSSPQRTMSEYDGSSNILAKYVNNYSPIAYRIVGEDRVIGGGGVNKMTYLYNLRTCKLKHFVSTEGFSQIATHDGKVKEHTKSLELPAELVPAVWPSMALGWLRLWRMSQKPKREKERKKEDKQAKLGKEMGEARSRQAQTDDPAAPLSFPSIELDLDCAPSKKKKKREEEIFPRGMTTCFHLSVNSEHSEPRCRGATQGGEFAERKMQQSGCCSSKMGCFSGTSELQ